MPIKEASAATPPSDVSGQTWAEYSADGVSWADSGQDKKIDGRARGGARPRLDNLRRSWQRWRSRRMPPALAAWAPMGRRSNPQQLWHHQSVRHQVRRGARVDRHRAWILASTIGWPVQTQGVGSPRAKGIWPANS